MDYILYFDLKQGTTVLNCVRKCTSKLKYHYKLDALDNIIFHNKSYYNICIMDYRKRKICYVMRVSNRRQHP